VVNPLDDEHWSSKGEWRYPVTLVTADAFGRSERVKFDVEVCRIVSEGRWLGQLVAQYRPRACRRSDEIVEREYRLAIGMFGDGEYLRTCTIREGDPRAVVGFIPKETPHSLARQVISGLESGNQRFHSVTDVSQLTGLTKQQVVSVLKAIMDSGYDGIIESDTRTVDDEELFTTQRHFDLVTPAWEKLLGALRLKSF